MTGSGGSGGAGGYAGPGGSGGPGGSVSERPRSFCLIGEGVLPAECGQELLARGHRITTVVTRHPPTRQWAESCGIDVRERLEHPTSERPDYLLSIVNPDLATATDLRFPRHAAVNFHSSPLPRYAGTHQTYWAIVNGEREYGVTWHLMTEHIDGGEILVQHRFALDQEETSLSLDMKCQEHGLASFRVLLDQLERDTLTPLPQDLGTRSYHNRRRRIPHAGIIDWSASASAIERLCRASARGAMENPFGTPKILVDERLYVLDACRVTLATAPREGTDHAVPGLVSSIGEAGAVIATGDGDLIVSGLKRLSGERVNPVDWAKECGLGPGSRLEPVDEALLTLADELSRRHCVNEEFWVEQLARCRPSWMPADDHDAGGAEPHSLALRVPISVAVPGEQVAATLLARWLRHAVATTGVSQSIWWSPEELRNELGPLSAAYSTALPITLDASPAPQALSNSDIDALMADATAHGTFPLDLPTRYPSWHLARPAPRTEIRVGPGSEPSPGELILAVSRDGHGLQVHCHGAELCFAAAQLATALLAS